MTGERNMPVWILCLLVAMHGSYGQLEEEYDYDEDLPTITPSVEMTHPSSTTKHSSEDTTISEATTGSFQTTTGAHLDITRPSNATHTATMTTVATETRSSSYRPQNIAGSAKISPCKCADTYSLYLLRTWAVVLTIFFLSKILLLIGVMVLFKNKKNQMMMMTWINHHCP
ncbi:uncharacterized protein LOC122946498 isoform X2 [Bufo gargarizans]|uniref:uncharacterized protein LOC122946498 isoform X2 n=1 Tax=Bufo gargarizans TaxID=30331 RepID=UPI001CF5A096|nr:uncharacterized protein LOC122946498 isoform X2 [Bufo gargarizans]